MSQRRAGGPSGATCNPDPLCAPLRGRFTFATHQYPVYNWCTNRVFARKVQSDWGWNWGPCYVPAGIQLPLFLRPLAPAVIADVASVVEPLGDPGTTSFTVTVTASVRASVATQAVLQLQGTWPQGSAAPTPVPVMLPPGNSAHTVSAVVAGVQLWWPRNLGAQHMYNLTVSLVATPRAGGDVIDTARRRVGFRTVELRQDPATDGNGTLFYFRVNGVAFFAMGANWIPSDTFAPRTGRERYEALLASAVAANFNMIRVWGGGRYEVSSRPPPGPTLLCLGLPRFFPPTTSLLPTLPQADEFYDLADELGLLVWQEAMFACAIYPAHESFLASVRDEVTAQATRLSHHPCLALWCGNNEVEQSKELETPDGWATYARLNYETVLPALRQTVGTSAALWPSSPSNGFQSAWSSPRDPSRGDVHYYIYDGVCSDESMFLQPAPRFQSEFGFPSYPSALELQPHGNASNGDFRVLSPWNGHRQDLNCPLANETAGPSGKTAGCQLPMMRRWFGELRGIPGSWRSNSSAVWAHSLFVSQLVQALCVKYQAEYLRRGRDTAAHTMGSLYWQLNSEWPGASKSSLEHAGRWKALHHEARRFYAPVHTSLWLSGVAAGGQLGVHVANDLQRAVGVNLTMSVLDFRGRTRARLSLAGGTRVDLASGTGRVVLRQPLASVLEGAPGCSPDTCFVSVATHVRDSDPPGTLPRDATPLQPQRPEVLFPRRLASVVLSPAAVSVHASAAASSRWLPRATEADARVRLTLRSAALALFVTLQSPYDGVFQPNVLHVIPGESVEVVFSPAAGAGAPPTAAQLSGSLAVLCANVVGDCRAP